MSYNNAPVPPATSSQDGSPLQASIANTWRRTGYGWAMAFLEHCKHQFTIRHDRALYALACDSEASAHYGLTPGKLWRLSVWLKAFVYAS